MPTSLRGRRFKPLLTMAVLAVLTILYLTSSARTSSSDFYTRTEDALAHQKQQEAERAAEDVNVGAGGALGVSGGTGSEVDVRKQLREAEERAKASADRKGEMERARLGMEALPDPQENAAAKDNEDVGNSNSAASAGKKTVPVREGVALDADDDDLWPVESDPELSDHEIVSPGEKNQVPVKTSGKEQTAETEEEHKVEQELNSILKRSPSTSNVSQAIFDHRLTSYSRSNNILQNLLPLQQKGKAHPSRPLQDNTCALRRRAGRASLGRRAAECARR